MKKVFALFCVLCLMFGAAFAEDDDYGIEASGGVEYYDDGSYTEWNLDSEGNATSITYNTDGTTTGYYSEAGGPMSEWTMDSEGNTTSTTYNNDGTSSGYYSEAGGYMSEWTMDEYGNTSSTAYNEDGSMSGYNSEAGGSLSEWSIDKYGNMSATTYNNDGSTSNYYATEGGPLSEWTEDKEGNTAVKVYNNDGSYSTTYLDANGNYIGWNTNADGSVSGFETNYYDHVTNNNTNNRSNNSNNTTYRYTNNNQNYSNPTYYAPSVTNASGVAYVTTSGGRLNVRSYPSKDASIVTKLERGTQVTVTGVSGEWTRISVGQYSGYVLSRYLTGQSAIQAPTPTPVPPTASMAPAQGVYQQPGTTTQQYLAMKKINPVNISVHPARVSGVVNLRWAPSESEPVISYLYEGYALTAIAFNNDWVQVIDPRTNDVGFIPRSAVTGL